MLLWMRVGDEDGYHDFDTVEDVAQYLHDNYDVRQVWRCNNLGVEDGENFTQNNYISLYWADGCTSDPIPLTDEEIEEINLSLQSCQDCVNNDLQSQAD